MRTRICERVSERVSEALECGAVLQGVFVLFVMHVHGVDTSYGKYSTQVEQSGAE